MLSKVLTIKFISLFLSAAVKFSLAVPIALHYYNFNFLQGFVFAMASGMFGVGVSLYLSKYIFMAWDYLKHKLTGERRKKGKLFTPRHRWIVKIKVKYGLAGLALITPSILSIPLGTIIAARIYHHDRRLVYLYMTLSLVIWSTVFSGIITYFN